MIVTGIFVVRDASTSAETMNKLRNRLLPGACLAGHEHRNLFVELRGFEDQSLETANREGLAYENIADLFFGCRKIELLFSVDPA